MPGDPLERGAAAPINKSLDVFIGALARTNIIASVAVPMVMAVISAIREAGGRADMTQEQVAVRINDLRAISTTVHQTADEWLRMHGFPVPED